MSHSNKSIHYQKIPCLAASSKCLSGADTTQSQAVLPVSTTLAASSKCLSGADTTQSQAVLPVSTTSTQIQQDTSVKGKLYIVTAFLSLLLKYFFILGFQDHQASSKKKTAAPPLSSMDIIHCTVRGQVRIWC